MDLFTFFDKCGKKLQCPHILGIHDNGIDCHDNGVEYSNRDPSFVEL